MDCTDTLTRILFAIILLPLGMSFIFWGLKLHKLIVRIMGALNGLIIGTLIGLAVNGGFSPEAYKVVISALIGAGLFYTIAYFFHKLFVVITNSLLTGGLFLLLCLFVSPDNLIAAFIVGFLVGLILTIIFYDFLVKIMFALMGYLFFLPIILPQFTSQISNGIRNYMDFFLGNMEPKDEYKWALFIFLSLIYLVLFALWFQHNSSSSKKDSDLKKAKKSFATKLGYRMFFIALFALVYLNLLENYYCNKINNLPDDIALGNGYASWTLKEDPEKMHNILSSITYSFNGSVGYVTFAIQSLILFLIFARLSGESLRKKFFKLRAVTRYLIVVVVSFILLPVTYSFFFWPAYAFDYRSPGLSIFYRISDYTIEFFRFDARSIEYYQLSKLTYYIFNFTDILIFIILVPLIILRCMKPVADYYGSNSA